MPDRLGLARHAAEHILHGKGGRQLLMGFEFGQIDNLVRLEGVTAEADMDAGFFQIYFPGLVQRLERHSQLLQRPGQFQGLRTGIDRPPRWRVTHHRPAAQVQHPPGHLQQQRRVRLHRPLRRLGRNKIRLEQHPIPPADKPLQPAQQGNLPVQRGNKIRRGIIITAR
ncbi:MAG: hypothetical protein BWY71_01896 [Planctomycetes bacterium ADurb.Bin412]|nr:MAG: hypothetical protein BWY71_01896 [Planctomycetes bacterium ADurb.Bin412]